MFKIYKIIDNTNNDIYIGITKQKLLSKRLSQHKERMNCMSSKIIKNGDYKIELIEETDDKTRERYWIENTDCINKQIPGRTKQEYYNDNRERLSQYKRNWKQNHRYYEKSWGGDIRYNNNSLLKIDPDLFNYLNF